SLHSIIDMASRRKHQHGHIHAVAPQFTTHLKSISTWELNIQEQKVIRFLKGLRQTPFAVLTGSDGITLSLQTLAQKKGQGRFVFNEQDPIHTLGLCWTSCGPRCAGKKRENEVPVSSELSTSTIPRWLSTARLTSVRPRP